MNAYVDFLLSLVPAFITSAAILFVGLWVNTTVRKKTQKDSILVSHLQERQRDIHQFIKKAVDAEEFDKCTANLRRLSNETQHLIDLHEQMCTDKNEKKQIIRDLEGTLFELKKILTATGNAVGEEDRERARQTGNQLRKKVLRVMFDVCESTEQLCR